MTTRLLTADWRDGIASLDAECGQMVLTSPPYYGLRSYLPKGHADKEREIGQEPTPEGYIASLVAGFRDMKRLIPKDGMLWINIGDSYCARAKGSLAGYKNKDLIGIPYMLAFALRADGWYWRKPIIWAKPNGMPESVKDRPTSSYEILLLLAKSPKYFYNNRAVRQPLAPSSIARLEQPNLEQQQGSHRANGGGKTNGPMKAVRFGGTKYAGNERNEGKENAGNLGVFRDEQRASDRNGANGGGCSAGERERERESAGRTYSGNEWRPSGSGL